MASPGTPNVGHASPRASAHCVARTAASAGQAFYVHRRGPMITLMHSHISKPPLGLQQVVTPAGDRKADLHGIYRRVLHFEIYYGFSDAFSMPSQSLRPRWQTQDMQNGKLMERNSDSTHFEF